MGDVWHVTKVLLKQPTDVAPTGVDEGGEITAAQRAMLYDFWPMGSII
jgi:hypothetical protein